MTVTDTRRILLIEDDDSTRLALRLLLEGRGHTVEEADDGLDGVRKALTSKPEVILLDLEMPVQDGYGVARRVRQALGGGVRLIALTGHDQPERALAAGFDAHLLKPADPERVCSLVKGVAVPPTR
jgi:two-component system, sensor histidine kinase